MTNLQDKSFLNRKDNESRFIDRSALCDMFEWRFSLAELCLLQHVKYIMLKCRVVGRWYGKRRKLSKSNSDKFCVFFIFGFLAWKSFPPSASTWFETFQLNSKDSPDDSKAGSSHVKDEESVKIEVTNVVSLASTRKSNKEDYKKQ